MPDRLTAPELDEILALQLTVAWAGERAGDPPRLGWWGSDLVDPEGGGDLFQRLAPRTARWASLILVRKVAQRVDEDARSKLARPDAVWSLFRFGFDVDEQLTERLAYHRQHLDEPREVFGARFLVGTRWTRAGMASMLGGLGQPKVEITPAGRQLEARPATPSEAAPLLAAALAPLADAYPLPYVEAPA